MEKYHFNKKDFSEFVASVINEKHTLKSAIKSAKKYLKTTVGEEYEILVDDIPEDVLVEREFIEPKFLSDDKKICEAEEKFLNDICDYFYYICDSDLELYENFRGGGWNGTIKIAEEDYQTIHDRMRKDYPMVTINKL